MQVEWLGPNHLKITHDRRARVSSSATSVNGVMVDFASE